MNDQEASVVVHSSSSIALLQERFRQLQKVKAMREEREVVKLLSLSQYSKSTHSCCSFFFNDTNTCVLLQPSITPYPQKIKKVAPTMLTLQLPQTSPSLSLTSSSHDIQPNNIPTLMDLWPLPTHTTTTSSCDSAISFVTKLNHHHHHDRDHDYSDSDIDVDTSLHL